MPPPNIFWGARVLVYSPDRPQTRDPPASASLVLGLQACTTTPDSPIIFKATVSQFSIPYSCLYYFKQCKKYVLNHLVCLPNCLIYLEL
jgi:hypothetical protein